MPASRALSLWLPVVVWAAVIFAFSSIPSLSTGLGLWDTILRKAAHMAEYAILGALLLRALGRESAGALLRAGLRRHGRDPPALRRGPPRSPIDVAIDGVGVAIGIFLVPRLPTRPGVRPSDVSVADIPLDRGDRAAGRVPRCHDPGTARRGPMKALAIELDGVLGDTRPLWRDWLEEAARRHRSIAPLDPAALSEDRAAAAEELDHWAAAGVGDWRAALARFAEDRAPVYLRPDAEVSAAVRTLAARDNCPRSVHRSPESLARIALSELGVDRRIEALETGRDALSRPRAILAGSDRRPGTIGSPLRIEPDDRGRLGDRQLDALLGRLDKINEELRAINRRLDSGEHLAPVVRSSPCAERLAPGPRLRRPRAAGPTGPRRGTG